MTKTGVISLKLEKLFSGEDTPSQEWIEHLLQRLTENYRMAADSFQNGLVVFLASWALFYLIGTGTVGEGDFLGFKITQVRNLLVAAPIVCGVLYYRIISSYSTILLLRDVIGYIYQYSFNKLYSLELDQLCLHHSLLDQEEVLNTLTKEGWMKKAGSAMRMLLYLSVLLLGIVAVPHLSLLLVTQGLVSPWLSIASVALGSLFVLQAVISLLRTGKLREP